MATISLCLIVKDEEETLGRCLAGAAHLVDEVIIVDTGSLDNTKAIAREYTDLIYDFVWIDDFAAARNEAFAYAASDYIFWLDADDVLTEENQEKFLALKQILKDESPDAVSMPYHLAFDESGRVSFSLRRNRLVKRARKFRWRGRVHEYLEIAGKIYASDVAIIHRSKGGFSDRNLKIYQKMLAEEEEFSPRDLYYYGNELADHGLYAEAVSVYEKFLADNRGWREDNISCCGKLADCYNSLGESEKALVSVLRSFGYDGPRPEFCCRLGHHFLAQANYLAALFWYRLATKITLPASFAGFTNQTYSTWLPHLQLAVCYDRLGAHRLAYLHNEAALFFRPADPIILANKELLAKTLKMSEI